MESRWRQNVNNYGLDPGGGFLLGQLHIPVLVAREHVLFPTLVIKGIGGGVSSWLTAHNLGGDLGWQITNANVIPAAHPHFPFGRNVESDRLP